MKKSDKLLWAYAIMNGDILPEGAHREYYGGWAWKGGSTYCLLNEETKKHFDKIFKVGVNVSKLSPMEDDRNKQFNGTFATSEDWVTDIKGTLVLNDGSKFICVVEETDTLEVVKELIDNPDIETYALQIFGQL